MSMKPGNTVEKGKPSPALVPCQRGLCEFKAIASKRQDEALPSSRFSPIFVVDVIVIIIITIVIIIVIIIIIGTPLVEVIIPR